MQRILKGLQKKGSEMKEVFTNNYVDYFVLLLWRYIVLIYFYL